MVTYKDMCELIEKANKKQNFLRDRSRQPAYPTASEIWEYNSEGSLMMLPIWYEQAKIIMGVK